jgi:cell division ATPase FtsA
LSAADAAVWRTVIAGQTLEVNVTKTQLESLAQPLIDRTLVAVRKVLRDAKVTRDDVQGVVMVGGSTRMPLVRSAVGELFGREVLTNVNPRRGRRHRRSDPGQCAGRQQCWRQCRRRLRRRVAVARRDRAVARS